MKLRRSKLFKYAFSINSKRSISGLLNASCDLLLAVLSLFFFRSLTPPFFLIKAAVQYLFSRGFFTVK
ncbi:hypothetical protein CW304_10450 [Bacillus sp. UFRGS-B20]|nr:hypothetical protein CW304_10450 [Bacillus sp. UFRGS-B20]